MKYSFIQTHKDELISKYVEQDNGETHYITQIGVIHHRSQLKEVIDEMALELQRDEQAYNEVSEPYRRALSLMNSCDEHAMLGQFDKAVNYANEAATLFPSMVEALRGIADSNFSLGKFADAITAYDRLIQLYPNIPDVHYQLGRSLFETGDHEQAILEFTKEMEISGEAPDIYLQIGSIYFSIAMVIFNRLYDSGERNPGRIYSECVQYLEKAKLAFESGIKIDPSLDELRRLMQQVTTVLNSLS